MLNIVNIYDAAVAGTLSQVEERCLGLVGRGELEVVEDPILSRGETWQKLRRTIASSNFGRSDSSKFFVTLIPQSSNIARCDTVQVNFFLHLFLSRYNLYVSTKTVLNLKRRDRNCGQVQFLITVE